MDIRVGFDINCNCPVPTPMVLMLSVHPERHRDLIEAESQHFDSVEPVHYYADSFGNICTRVLAPAGLVNFRSTAIVRDHGAADPVDWSAEEIPVARLPDAAIQYVIGSRFCETDPLATAAWGLFGSVKPGWQRVQAICDYVHNHVTFDYNSARSTRTAADTFREQRGVCRDFAHLAIAFCRSMNIPARYCTGYLGDIGVPIQPYAMDFSAWFDVYLSGKWHTFDARHNTPRIGRVLMARGRDAEDVPMITSFGQHQLLKFDVVTDELVEGANA